MRGKDGRHNTAWSLRSAQEILQESFDPIMDLGSNTDLLPVMLYARRAGEWDYSNCLTLLLRHKVGGCGRRMWCVGGGGYVGYVLRLLFVCIVAVGGRLPSDLQKPMLTAPSSFPTCRRRASPWWQPSAASLALRWRSCR